MKHTHLFSILLILVTGICFAQEPNPVNVKTDEPAVPFTAEAASVTAETPITEPTTETLTTDMSATKDDETMSGLPTTPHQAKALKDITTGSEKAKEKEELERQKEEQQKKEAEAKKNQKPKINLWELIKNGGFLMYPIAALSILGLAFALERFVMLRRGAIMPNKLFNQIAPYLQPGVFNPQAVWDICAQYPSPAGRIIQAMLLKIGRPLPEIEAAANATKQEEATNMYSNVRWIILVSSLAPLLGLLGTVWGMIEAFYITANQEIGANRAEQLSSGIYVALVTTAAGLVVAIPAAFIAHWYEGKILNAFKKLDSSLLPIFDALEQQEGKPRITLAQYQAKK